jgi:hypothetical protein
LNWSGKAIDDKLKVSLKTSFSNVDIKSAQGVRVSSIQNNNQGRLEFTLDKLEYADILTIQEKRSS